MYKSNSVTEQYSVYAYRVTEIRVYSDHQRIAEPVQALNLCFYFDLFFPLFIEMSEFSFQIQLQIDSAHYRIFNRIERLSIGQIKFSERKNFFSICATKKKQNRRKSHLKIKPPTTTNSTHKISLTDKLTFTKKNIYCWIWKKVFTFLPWP